MKIANGSIISISAAGPDWTVAFDLGDGNEIVCPLIGWATVVEAHFSDGTTATRIEPAFLWDAQVWTGGELREHTPTLEGFEIRAREIVHA